MKNQDIFEQFDAILSSKDPKKAYEFYQLDFSGCTEDEVIQMEMKLFEETWHTLHDELANGFQIKRNPTVVGLLCKAVLDGKIPEFEYKPVSRKCTWALADIGTEEALECLKAIALSKDETLAGYAKKRILLWEDELERKGQTIPASRVPFGKRIRIEPYYTYLDRIPKTGKRIIGFQTDDEMVVYQAYKPSIAEYAVEKQTFGGLGFSFKRMSWIKPNFLWMMFRSGWAEKINQERVLAIWVKKKAFEQILNQAILTTFDEEIYGMREIWQRQLSVKRVRVQWDPDHDPQGNKLERKAIQLGLAGEALHFFANEAIQYVEDITPFVKKQSLYVKRNELDKLWVPVESESDYTINFH